MEKHCDSDKCNTAQSCDKGNCSCKCSTNACADYKCKEKSCPTECNTKERCPCDLLGECTGIKKCSTEKGTGYCIVLPHGLQKSEIKAEQNGNTVHIEYYKEMNEKGTNSRRAGAYTFTLENNESVKKVHIEGCKLIICLDNGGEQKSGELLIE
ncbi:hypothetical protein NEFER03_0263 [Nematocida sp. LUAm3]|nr:hypothetical protein NEFER03_0263 [Nematocida sp. LUAm3]KAI5173716.1 hypothetical protein NEFER02_0232 [Nematocida sp. LUAm2]KAI5176938.1 hypothetical protein NEFER01_0263 [Nematocida sp. LUAm1]